MDNCVDSRISFDENGVCNYCKEYDLLKNLLVFEGEKGELALQNKIREIKEKSNGAKYDCILGLSGGVDSSYLALLAKKYGLNPLCLHFDNGWNSEQSVQNIENIVNRLNFDLITCVINWEEFRDLQRAYLLAGVIDIEALTDHAIFASLYKIALEKNISYVLSGSNVVTEGILPSHWTHRKSDFINIKSIHKKFGKIPIKSFPLLNLKLKNQIKKYRIETVELLNWIPYNKFKAKQKLMEELSWKDYGGKHYESKFTKFYQAFILPTKFGVDKRKAHLSTLICSGQISRQQALEEMELPLYNKLDFKNEKAFVIKKLGFNEFEFDELMKQTPVPHDLYEVEGSFFNYYPLFKIFKPFWEIYKKYFIKEK
jgi:N-acetyl sugar amidotransferase